MSLLSFPQSIRVAETVLLSLANVGLCRWSIPSELNYAQFSLVIKNLSNFQASFTFQESDGDPATDLVARIGIPQNGGQVPLPTAAVLTCTLAAGSGSITVTSGDTSTITTGMAVTGTGVPAGTTVASVTDSTHFVMSAGATASGTNVVVNVGGLSSQDAVIVGFVHTTTYDQFEGTFTDLAGTACVLSSGAQKTLYFTTKKHFVQLRADVANNAIVKIVGSSTANISLHSKRNSRGAI